MRGMTRLITIPFSHYCEKARWALDVTGVPYAEEGHLPMFHFAAVKRAGGKRTVPILVHGEEVIADSTPIVAWCDAQRPGALLPRDEVDRAAALQLEDDFDMQLGPATRRWAYFHLLPQKSLVSVMTQQVPRWQAVAFRATRPVALAAIRRGLKIDEAGVARSLAKIEDAFARVDQLLADGRKFLVGNRFSVADLTFASLAAPVLLPPEHPVPMPAFADMPAAAQEPILRWQHSRAGQHVLRLYQTERAVRTTPRAA